MLKASLAWPFDATIHSRDEALLDDTVSLLIVLLRVRTDRRKNISENPHRTTRVSASHVEVHAAFLPSRATNPQSDSVEYTTSRLSLEFIQAGSAYDSGIWCCYGHVMQEKTPSLLSLLFTWGFYV
jgi:hypothetical protein